MQRAEVWWAHLSPPSGRRPVVLISREKAIHVRNAVTVAQVTTSIRDIPVEVPLGREDNMPKPCVINCDVILTIPKENLVERITVLSSDKQKQLNKALQFVLGLEGD